MAVKVAILTFSKMPKNWLGWAGSEKFFENFSEIFISNIWDKISAWDFWRWHSLKISKIFIFENFYQIKIFVKIFILTKSRFLTTIDVKKLTLLTPKADGHKGNSLRARLLFSAAFKNVHSKGFWKPKAFAVHIFDDLVDRQKGALVYTFWR